MIAVDGDENPQALFTSILLLNLAAMMDGIGKNPEETESSPSQLTKDLDVLLESQYRTGIVLPHYARHREEKPRWYLEISREPRQVNSHNKTIGLGSFFKR